jgi:hypothetical protein
MICLFDCLVEGIAALFVFGRVSDKLAMIKSGGSCFQFHANAAINPWFLVREGFNGHRGYDISNALANKLAHRVSVYINEALSGPTRDLLVIEENSLGR